MVLFAAIDVATTAAEEAYHDPWSIDAPSTFDVATQTQPDDRDEEIQLLSAMFSSKRDKIEELLKNRTRSIHTPSKRGSKNNYSTNRRIKRLPGTLQASRVEI